MTFSRSFNTRDKPSRIAEGYERACLKEVDTWLRLLILAFSLVILIALAVVSRLHQQPAPFTPTTLFTSITPTVVPSVNLTSPPASDPVAFLATLQSLTVPQRDLAQLAQRLGKMPTNLTVSPSPPNSRYPGIQEVFWVTDVESREHFTVTATLRYVSDHLLMYVDNTITWITDDRLRASVDVFETRTYSTTRAYFGTAWAPGLDGDERLTILHVNKLGATGAFSAADEESPLGNPYSNGRHMVYINVTEAQPGTAAYDAVLAHEFQHAIHFFQDRNEDAWLNEGASVLSELLNGYSPHRTLEAFRRHPDTQLTSWSDEPSLGAHYGAAFAFLNYFHERYGDQALLWLIEEQANGADGINRVLERLGKTERFNDVFADWMVANILDDPTLENGHYGHQRLDIRLPVSNSHRSLPAADFVADPQYAAHYVEFRLPQSTATIIFTGTTTTRLVNNEAHSGRYQWWSNRGDLVNTTLTRAFDLSGLASATLTFWVWYDLEEDWDYAYVLVSTDNGQSWTTLQTEYTTTTNPVGNNLGHGYTGRSGGGSIPQWLADKVDLTPYAGKKILVRFEYITDDAINNPGFCVDDISIPELGFYDDAESNEEWEAHGFVRSSNLIPQSYILRLITFGASTIEINEIAVDAEGRAQVTVQDTNRAILVIAGTAPITTEPAYFRYSIQSP